MGNNGRENRFKQAYMGGVPVIGAKAPSELERLRKIFLEKLRDIKKELTWDIQVKAKRVRNQNRRVFNIFLLGWRDFGGGLKFQYVCQLTSQREDKFDPEGTGKGLSEAAEIIWAEYQKFKNKYGKE